MSSEKFRELLVKMVKASGQELIDRAEDLVGNGDCISDFNIWVLFPTDERMLTACPTIKVTREHVSKHMLDVIINDYTEEPERLAGATVALYNHVN